MTIKTKLYYALLVTILLLAINLIGTFVLSVRYLIQERENEIQNWIYTEPETYEPVPQIDIPFLTQK